MRSASFCWVPQTLIARSRGFMPHFYHCPRALSTPARYRITVDSGITFVFNAPTNRTRATNEPPSPPYRTSGVRHCVDALRRRGNSAAPDAGPKNCQCQTTLKFSSGPKASRLQRMVGRHWLKEKDDFPGISTAATWRRGVFALRQCVSLRSCHRAI